MAWYQERCTALDNLKLPPGTVIGPAEYGNRTDAGLLRPLLAHPAAQVRAQAVAELRALDRVDAQQLRPLLDDPGVRVVHKTAIALLPSTKELPSHWLQERTSSAQPRHARLGAFQLLDAHGRIVALRAAVSLLEDPDTKLHTWAGQSEQRWHPPADLRHRNTEVGQLLNRSRHLLSDHALHRRKQEARANSRVRPEAKQKAPRLFA